MAYNTNGLSMLASPVGGGFPRVFGYDNTDEDSDGTIVGASYFSDGAKKGMRVGDLVDAVERPTAKYKRYQVASVSGDAATVAAPTAIS